MKTFLGILFAVAVTNSRLLAAVDCFLKIDSITGESQFAGHVGEIELLSYKIGVQQAALTSFAGGGASASKSQFTPLTIFKNVDKTSPSLFLGCATGKHFKTLTLTVTDVTEVPVDFFKITLTDVIISSVNNSGSGDGAMESASFSYATISWSFTPISGGNTTQGGFDIKKNVLLTQ